MIQVTMYEGKWRFAIIDETWKFDNQKDMIATLDAICKLKEKYGKIK